MYPKKAKELIPEYAKEKGLPEGDVEDMVWEFWRAMRKNASELANPYLKIRGMGHLHVSYKKVSKDLYKQMQIRRATNRDKASKEWIDAREKQNLLVKMMRMIEAEWKLMMAHRGKKKAYRRNKKKNDELERDTEGGMGEQGSDS